MKRRMFSQQIVDSDAFLDMPIGSQLLYFHLSMRADDDGFVGNPKKVMRMIGSQDDDFKVLLAKRFIIQFESGVCVVKHWLIHNLIRSDLYRETTYKNEKRTLGLNENGAYTELRDGVDSLKQVEEPNWLKIRRNSSRTVNVPQTVPRIGKDREGKKRESASVAAPPAELMRIFLSESLDNQLATVKTLKINLTEKDLEAFISYWTEPNKSGTKQRWELQKTFEVKRRLKTWANNQKQFTNQKNDDWQY